MRFLSRWGLPRNDCYVRVSGRYENVCCGDARCRSAGRPSAQSVLLKSRRLGVPVGTPLSTPTVALLMIQDRTVVLEAPG
jgi:hypothetical protein